MKIFTHALALAVVFFEYFVGSVETRKVFTVVFIKEKINRELSFLCFGLRKSVKNIDISKGFIN